MKKADTLREKEVQIIHPLPSISIGNKRLTLLRYLYDNQESRLNIKKYSKVSGIRRSTVYYHLNQLVIKGLVSLKRISDLKFYKINDNGIDYVNVTNGSVSNVRRECRDSTQNMSMHYIKYKLPIKDKTKFSESRISELNPIRWKESNLFNQKILYVFFEDVTIIIHQKCVLIRIPDILAENAEEAEIKALDKTMKYIVKLNEIGLQEQSISLDSAHFARVKSILSEYLEKIDNRYFLDLGDKKKFWIDNSNDKLEDETNDITVRQRVDKTMRDIMRNDIDLKEIDKIKEVLGMITKNLAILTMAGSQSKDHVLKTDKVIERPGYIG